MAKDEFKTLLYKIRPAGPVFKFYPHKATLNYYIGCIHDCKYCYAHYTMKNVGLEYDEFGTNVVVKKDVEAILQKELSKKAWQSYSGIIHLGTVQDPFQPLERKHRCTNTALNMFYEAGKPVTILTKSKIALDSLDILKKMAKRDLVHIDYSIAYYDEELRKELEPGASSIEERFEAIKELSDNGITSGIFINPAIPYYTDAGLEQIIRRASECGARYIMLGFIHLNRQNYRTTKAVLEKHLPSVDIDSLFEFNRNIVLKEDACYELSKKCHDLCVKYNIPFITTQHHEFRTGNYDFGVYRYRFPLAYDYVDMLMENKGKVFSYEDAVQYIQKFNHDKSYLTSLKWYWNNQKLFNDFPYLNIRTDVVNDEVRYCLED